MNTSKILSTNRTLLRVTPLAPLRDLRIACFPEYEKQTLAQLQSMPAYYLMDNPLGEGFQEPLKEKAVSRISSTIFNQELSEMAIPCDRWPDIEDYNVFKDYFKVDHLALTADLGSGPVVTSEVL